MLLKDATGALFKGPSPPGSKLSWNLSFPPHPWTGLEDAFSLWFLPSKDLQGPNTRKCSKGSLQEGKCLSKQSKLCFSNTGQGQCAARHQDLGRRFFCLLSISYYLSPLLCLLLPPCLGNQPHPGLVLCTSSPFTLSEHTGKAEPFLGSGEGGVTGRPTPLRARAGEEGLGMLREQYCVVPYFPHTTPTPTPLLQWRLLFLSERGKVTALPCASISSLNP